MVALPPNTKHSQISTPLVILRASCMCAAARHSMWFFGGEWKTFATRFRRVDVRWEGRGVNNRNSLNFYGALFQHFDLFTCKYVRMCAICVNIDIFFLVRCTFSRVNFIFVSVSVKREYGMLERYIWDMSMCNIFPARIGCLLHVQIYYKFNVNMTHFAVELRRS